MNGSAKTGRAETSRRANGECQVCRSKGSRGTQVLLAELRGGSLLSGCRGETSGAGRGQGPAQLCDGNRHIVLGITCRHTLLFSEICKAGEIACLSKMKKGEQQQMKLTRHNGRSGKNGTYNPKHNDRSFDVGNSEHIDPERSKQNVYWDCYQGLRFPTKQEGTDQIIYSFEQIEKAFYSERYDDLCEGQHERNKKTGHSARDRTTSDLWADKRTCPEESVIQIGTKELSVPPEVLVEIAVEFFAEFDRRFGEHIHILDWALHMDEATPHIQERHVFDCENKYGEIEPQQEKALEALGVDHPNPDRKRSKINSRKITFDAACRTMLFDICERHGVHLDREPEYGGRAYLEKQDYILMKQKEKIEIQDQQISEKDEALDEILTIVYDTEEFIDEIADAAYEKAVEAVTEKVREEVRNEDFEIIADTKASLFRSYKFTPDAAQLIEAVFSDIMDRFKGMTQHISDRLAAIFRAPETRKEVKKPIKESIRSRLSRGKIEADARNAARRNRRNQPNKRRQQDMDL